MMKSHATLFPIETMLKQFSDANQSLVNDWQKRFNFTLEPNGDFAATYQKLMGALSQQPTQWAEQQQIYQANQMKLWESFLSRGAVGTQAKTEAKGDRVEAAGICNTCRGKGRQEG